MSTPSYDRPLPGDTLLPAAADAEFDQMAALTKRVLDVPMALVSLVSSRGQVVPGLAGGQGELEAERSLELSASLCQYVVRSDEPFVVPDTTELDLLAGNGAVTDGGVRAYAGMPLQDGHGTTIGSLCVTEPVPRRWTSQELATLRDLAAACSAQLQLREAATRAAVASERDRIARDLHERVIADLFRLSMSLGGLRTQLGGRFDAEMSAAIDAVDRAIARIRDSVFDA